MTTSTATHQYLLLNEQRYGAQLLATKTTREMSETKLNRTSSSQDRWQRLPGTFCGDSPQTQPWTNLIT